MQLNAFQNTVAPVHMSTIVKTLSKPKRVLGSGNSRQYARHNIEQFALATKAGRVNYMNGILSTEWRHIPTPWSTVACESTRLAVDDNASVSTAPIELPSPSFRFEAEPGCAHGDARYLQWHEFDALAEEPDKTQSAESSVL